MPQYSDEEKEPFLNDDLELGCTSLKNRRQNIRGVNFLIQIRNAFWFTIYFVKILLKKSTQFLMAEEQSNALVGNDDDDDDDDLLLQTINKTYKKVRWKDFEGRICYAMLSVPEYMQYYVCWFTTTDAPRLLYCWKTTLDASPTVRVYYTGAKLLLLGGCAICEIIRFSKKCEYVFPIVPRHQYSKLSFMNLYACALCGIESFNLYYVGKHDASYVTGSFSAFLLLVHAIYAALKLFYQKKDSIKSLDKFLKSDYANDLPKSVLKALKKEVKNANDIEMHSLDNNDAENAADDPESAINNLEQTRRKIDSV